MNAMAADPRIDMLEAALQAERAALLANDVDGLLCANREKLAALTVLEADPPSPSLHPRIAALSRLNRDNGALLARRRREIDWALQHLGRVEAGSGYDASGRCSASVVGRPLASA